MPSSPNPDVVIRDLFEVLLDRLKDKIVAEVPLAISWIERLAKGDPVVYLTQHPDVWVRHFRSFDPNERELLTGLLDLSIGLESVRFMSEKSMTATDLRTLRMFTLMLPIVIVAVLERLERLAKRAFRTGMVDESTMDGILRVATKYREQDSFLEERDASAHGSYVRDDSWLRTPENLRLWELAALTAPPRDPSAWTHVGEIPADFHDHTCARLATVESTVGRALTMLLRGLEPSP